ncbi:hypothetical protein SLE2022_362760 [Rubroshorea leprosula]
MADCIEYGIYLNFGGKFIRNPTLRYVGGTFHSIWFKPSRCQPAVFREKLQELNIDMDGLTDFVWYKHPAKRFDDDGLVLIISDESIEDMFQLLMFNGYIDVYVEHESQIQRHVTKGGPSHGNNGSLNDAVMVGETVACNVDCHTYGVEVDLGDKNALGFVTQECQIVAEHNRNSGDADGRIEDVLSGDEYIDVPWLTDNEDEEWQFARNQYKDTLKLYADAVGIERALVDPSEAYVEEGISDSIDSDDEVSFVTTSDDSDVEEARRRRSLHKVFDESTVIPQFEIRMIFFSRKQFKDAVLTQSIYMRRKTMLKKNDKKESGLYAQIRGAIGFCYFLWMGGQEVG